MLYTRNGRWNNTLVNASHQEIKGKYVRIRWPWKNRREKQGEQNEQTYRHSQKLMRLNECGCFESDKRSGNAAKATGVKLGTGMKKREIKTRGREIFTDFIAALQFISRHTNLFVAPWIHNLFLCHRTLLWKFRLAIIISAAAIIKYKYKQDKHPVT